MEAQCLFRRWLAGLEELPDWHQALGFFSFELGFPGAPEAMRHELDDRIPGRAKEWCDGVFAIERSKAALLAVPCRPHCIVGVRIGEKL